MFTVLQPYGLVTPSNNTIYVFWAAPSGQAWASGHGVYTSGATVYNQSGTLHSTISSQSSVSDFNGSLRAKFVLNTPLSTGAYTFNCPVSSVVDATGNKAAASGFEFTY